MSEKKIKKIRKMTASPELSSHVIGAHNIDDVISKIVRREKAPKFIVIDLFCGAGGTGTGFAQAHGNALVIACVNHDYKAIKSHWLNYPDVAHFEEDIRSLDLRPLLKLLNYYRKLYPDAKVILWASLECTNFSKAKGGQARDADSRTLADHLHRYIKVLNPDYIQIENVVEFMSWGPLTSKVTISPEGFKMCEFKWEQRKKKWVPIWKGVPESKRNGRDFVRWCNRIKAGGYYNEWKELNSADFGAYTSRNRLFGIFARPELPITWPEPTHAKKPEKASLYRSLKKWMPVKHVLDFDDEGHSIFNRETNKDLRSQDRKPLVDKTLARIYAGLIKFVAGLKQDAFIAKYYSGRPEGKISSIEDPAGVIATAGNQSLIKCAFIARHNGGDPDGKVHSVDSPSGARTTIPQQRLVQAFISQYNGGDDWNRNKSLDEPAGVLTTENRFAIVNPEFLYAHYSNGDNVSSVETPCPTISTKDRFGLVQPAFIDKQYGTTSVQSIEQPAGTIMGNDKHSLIQCEKFIMPTNFDNSPSSVEDPAPVITANRKHHYLVNPSHGGHCTSSDAPCPVIVARQDKAPLYLVQTESGNVSVAIYDTDSEITVKIKEFMALYGIVDIRMRMLKVPELLKIQGFPEGYVLEGTKADQKKFIGNSVVPHVVKAWAIALAERINQSNQKVA
jgi:DNA (cytosine-5)-methyltransferase 1